LEDTLERLIVPPSEIRRAMDYIHSCDLKWQNAMAQWKDRQDKLLLKVKSRIEGKPRDGSVDLKALGLPQDDPDLKVLSQLKALVFQLADQKVVAAQCAFDLLDLQLQKLTADSTSFEKELKSRGELMDTDDHDRGYMMEEDDPVQTAPPALTASQHQQSLALQQQIQQAMSQVQKLQHQIAQQSQLDAATTSEAGLNSSKSSNSSFSGSTLLQQQQKASVASATIAATLKKSPTVTTTPSANALVPFERTSSPSVQSSMSQQSTSTSTLQQNVSAGLYQLSQARTQFPALTMQQSSPSMADGGLSFSSASSDASHHQQQQQQQQSDPSQRAVSSSNSSSATFTERKPGGGITIAGDLISSLSKLPPTPSTSSTYFTSLLPNHPHTNSSPPKLSDQETNSSQTPNPISNPPASSQRVVIPSEAASKRSRKG